MKYALMFFAKKSLKMRSLYNFWLQFYFVLKLLEKGIKIFKLKEYVYKQK